MNIRSTFLTFFIIFSLTSLNAYANSSEMRAFWVVRFALANEKDIESVVHTAYEAGITDLFVQVRALGQTYYKSILESNAPALKEDFDPLQKIVEKCKLYNIRVHAWVNMFYIWSGDYPPKNKNHVFYKLNNQLLRIKSLPEYKDLRKDGIEGFFLNPENSEVQHYLLNLLLEIADKYEVSGIHLDYFRFPGVKYSFTPGSRTKFMMDNYFDPINVYLMQDDYVSQRGYEVFVQADKLYRKFLSSSLSSYLETIARALKIKNNNLRLSVAVKPDPVQAKHRYFQDWKSWLEKKICDFVVMMNYRTNLDEFTFILNQINEPQLKKRIIVGISTYNQNSEAVRSRIKFVKSGQFAGFSLFSYNHLVKNRGYLKNLKLYN